LLDYEDLSDSRELLNAREPNFIAIFIYFLLLLLISAIIWLCLGEIDIVVKATGMVRTISHVSVIRNINEGIVTQLNYREGQRVQKGDLLYTAGNRFDEIENESLLIQKKKTLAEIDMLTRMEAGVISHENQFQANQTPLENEYYNRFEAYQNKYEQLKAIHEQAQTDWIKGKELGADVISQNSLDQLVKDYKFAELELKKYQNETIFAMKKDLQTRKDQLLQMDDRLNELEEKFSRCQVRAPISGIVQVIENFNQGDFMPAGIEVLKIVPGRKTANLKMELTIANQDIGLVKTGQRVNYRFLALPFKEYGVLAGKVKVVAGDIWAVQDSAMPYRVEGTIGKTKLFDKSGVPAEIKVGMLCEARITVKHKKLLYIVLEKLDFR
jgi:multidrug resistance efflux pump